MTEARQRGGMRSPLFGVIVTWIIEPLVLAGLALLLTPRLVERLRKPRPDD